MCYCLIKYDVIQILQSGQKKIQVYVHMYISMYICMYLPVKCILLLCWLCYFKNRSVRRHKGDLYVKKYWKSLLPHVSYCFFYCSQSAIVIIQNLGALGLIPRLSLISVILMSWHHILPLLILTTIAIINSFKCYISFYSLTFSFSRNYF